MTNEQYQSLWDVNDGSAIYMVIDIQNDQDLGNIVAASWEEATKLLERGINQGTYTATAILVELVSMDKTLN